MTVARQGNLTTTTVTLEKHNDDFNKGDLRMKSPFLNMEPIKLHQLQHHLVYDQRVSPRVQLQLRRLHGE